jgi:co-chaperonin GroES (HSP10)
MKMLGNNVLVSEVQKENTTASVIILTGETDQGSKPGLVLAVSTEALGPLMSGNRVFLDWSKSMPVNVDGKAAVIIDAEHIKAIITEE